MKEIYVGIDAGLNGHIVAINKQNEVIFSSKMPINMKLLSKAKKKKIGTYKNGKPKFKIIKPAKYKKEIDIVKFHREIFKLSNCKLIVAIESQRGIAGNSARSSSTISFNYGQLLGSLKILTKQLNHSLCYSIKELHEIQPQQWKKHFGLFGIKDKSQRKQASIDKAKELGFNPKSHDEAEALLLALYIKEKRSKNEYRY